MVGRIVKFTPNGLSVRSRARAISLARSAGVGCVSAVMSPSPPASETAAANSARPTHCIPPCTMGCSMPNDSVNLVVIKAVNPFQEPDGIHDGRRVWTNASRSELTDQRGERFSRKAENASICSDVPIDDQ